MNAERELAIVNAIAEALNSSPDVRLALERTLSLGTQIIRLHFHQIATDHSIACGGGYMTAVCPADVCDPSLASLASDPRLLARRGSVQSFSHIDWG